MGSKAAHVKRQAASVPAGGHHCHWPGCRKAVPAAMWSCKTHWFALPERLRKPIWAAYRPGQEDDKNPSPEYLAATRAACDWVKAQGVEVPRQGDLL